MKAMYPIKWVLPISVDNVLSLKDNHPVVRNIPDKYILNLFRIDRVVDPIKFKSENDARCFFS